MRKNSKEPDWSPAFKDGFLRLPTSGMRLAPQVLVLEIMREVAFPKVGATSSENSKALPLDPTLEDGPLAGAPLPVLASLFALRGRVKERKAQSSFYAPAYPEIAAFGWMRKKTDRVVRDFFLRGALASGIAGNDELGRLVPELTVSALYRREDSVPDVLALCAAMAPRFGELTVAEEAIDSLNTIVATPPDWGLNDDDVISRRIAKDWSSLCRLEPYLPRLAWIEMVGVFLRTVIPLWLLAQMRVCVLTRDFASDCLEGRLRSASDVRVEIDRRHEALLVPSTTLTDRVDQAIIEYMRARIELKVLLRRLAERDEKSAAEFSQPLAVEPREGFMSLDRLGEVLRDENNRSALMREVLLEAESYPGWGNPLKVGQGKNIEEFLRVMRNDHVGGQDDGFLLERGPPNRRLFRVFPAPKVIALFVLLAHTDKTFRHGRSQRLLLADLEDAFKELGIDFTVLGGVRAELLRSLANAGILSGTPDAGEGAILSNPYLSALKSLEEGILR